MASVWNNATSCPSVYASSWAWHARSGCVKAFRLATNGTEASKKGRKIKRRVCVLHSLFPKSSFRTVWSPVSDEMIEKQRLRKLRTKMRSPEVWREMAREREFQAARGSPQCGGSLANVRKHWGFQRGRNKRESFVKNRLAEREGFEPPIRLPVCRISSAVLSTTQPPLPPECADAI